MLLSYIYTWYRKTGYRNGPGRIIQCSATSSDWVLKSIMTSKPPEVALVSYSSLLDMSLLAWYYREKWIDNLFISRLFYKPVYFGIKSSTKTFASRTQSLNFDDPSVFLAEIAKYRQNSNSITFPTLSVTVS